MTRDDLELALLLAAITAIAVLAACHMRRKTNIAALAGHAAGLIDGKHTYDQAYTRAARDRVARKLYRDG